MGVTAAYLACGLVNLVNLFNPEAVIVGGELSVAGVDIMPLIKEEVERRSHPLFSPGLKLVSSSYDEDQVAKGAALLVLQHFYASPQKYAGRGGEGVDLEEVVFGERAWRLTDGSGFRSGFQTSTRRVPTGRKGVCLCDRASKESIPSHRRERAVAVAFVLALRCFGGGQARESSPTFRAEKLPKRWTCLRKSSPSISAWKWN